MKRIIILIILILTIGIVIVRFFRQPSDGVNVRKFHLANEIGFDSFFEKIFLILPKELDNYSERKISELDDGGLFQCSFNGRYRALIYHESTNECKTLFPFFSKEVNDHFQREIKSKESSIDPTHLTFVNISAFNDLIRDLDICNQEKIINKFFLVKELGSVPNGPIKILKDYRSIDKSQHRKLISDYYNENSMLGDTSILLRFRSEIDNNSRICHYGFFFERCSISRIQFNCLIE